MWVVRKGVRFRLGRHWATNIKELTSSFSLGSVLYMWLCVVCILEGWVCECGRMSLFICCVKGLVLLSCRMEEVVVCVNFCIAGRLWLAVCERVMRLMGWLLVGCS